MGIDPAQRVFMRVAGILQGRLLTPLSAAKNANLLLCESPSASLNWSAKEFVESACVGNITFPQERC
jgi:hypothetical protein